MNLHFSFVPTPSEPGIDILMLLLLVIVLLASVISALLLLLVTVSVLVGIDILMLLLTLGFPDLLRIVLGLVGRSTFLRVSSSLMIGDSTVAVGIAIELELTLTLLSLSSVAIQRKVSGMSAAVVLLA